MDSITSIIVVALIIVYSTVTQSIKDKRAREKRMLQQEEEPIPTEEQTRPIVILTNAPSQEQVSKEIKPIAPTKQQPKAKTKALKVQKNRNNDSQSHKNKSTAQQVLPKNDTTKIDFDVERAVLEAEILKPKYLEY